ncbi:MAG TPA: DUF3617 family protein [Xanthobacteraceae bacterium]|nr:DUF3617 family protein [Xanthobacteraceae bacterium]
MKCALGVAMLVFAAAAARADGIEPGLWKIITLTETAGAVSPPHESEKCLTAAQTADLATTFSPVTAGTVNSVCAPIERSFADGKLTWHLVCKGQLDVDLSGDFTFDAPHHYTGTIRTKATMAGQVMADSQNMLEGQWVSTCQ